MVLVDDYCFNQKFILIVQECHNFLKVGGSSKTYYFHHTWKNRLEKTDIHKHDYF